MRDKLNHKIEIKTWIALVAFIFMLLSTFASVVAMKTNLEARVKVNAERIADHEDFTKAMEDSVHNHEIRLTTIETNYKHITDSLVRIENKLED